MSSIFGSAGYVACLKFFSPVVVANAYLIEPIVAESLGYIMGIDQFPGILTILGSTIMLIGVILIDKKNADEAKPEEERKN